jgi:hypothetical protein
MLSFGGGVKPGPHVVLRFLRHVNNHLQV